MTNTPISAEEAGPKYRRLFEQLRESIEERRWLPGARMPSERELIRETGLSLPTVRRAYDELTRQGYVARIQGRGTLVLERKSEQPLLRVGIYSSGEIYEAYRDIFASLGRGQGLPYQPEAQLLHAGVRLEEAYRHFDAVLPGPMLLGKAFALDLAAPLRGRVSRNRLDHPGLFADYLQDDALRAMPLTWSPLAICCNLDVLRKIGFEAPEQLRREDLLGISDAVSACRSRTGEMLFSFPCTTFAHYRWLPFLWQAGCDLFTGGGSCDEEALWEAVEFLRRLHQHESCFLCPRMVSLLNEELVARGDFAFCFLCSYQYDYILRRTAGRFACRLYEFPAGERRVTSVNSIPYTVSRFSPRKTEAIDLYRRLTAKSVQIELFRRGGLLPVVPVSQEELADSPVDAAFFLHAATAGRATDLHRHADIQRFSELLALYLTRLLPLEELQKELGVRSFAEATPAVQVQSPDCLTVRWSDGLRKSQVPSLKSRLSESPMV